MNSTVTGQLADTPTRGLGISRTGQVADWTTRGPRVDQSVRYLVRESSSPRVGNPRVGVSASCPVTLLYDSLNLMVSGVKLWAVMGPKLRRKEVQSFALQQLDCVESCKMHWCTVLL